MTTTLKNKDRVRYTDAFLKSIGGDYFMSMRRGTVVNFKIINGETYPRVLWDDVAIDNDALDETDEYTQTVKATAVEDASRPSYIK